MERWVDAVGYPGKYRVSDHGRVAGRKILKLGAHRDGYLQVKLFWGTLPSTTYVHRMVAEAFVPRREGCREVDHIDGDKTNNHASNLRWVTREENMQAAQALGLLTQPDNSGHKNGMAKLSREDVAEIRELLAQRFTHERIAQRFGVSRRCIGRIADGSRWAK